MTVRELIGKLLECNMDSNVTAKLRFMDADFRLDEADLDVSAPTKFNFEDAILDINFDWTFEEKLEEWKKA